LFKCTPRVNLVKTRKKEEKNTDKPVNIERLPPPILAKLSKEVKEISKYFKTVCPTQANVSNEKLYTQASKSRSSIKEIFKIKKIFLNLKADKIENIQKIIKDNGKLKPRINMTTKGPSKKQVIVLINNNNKTKFMEDSCNHVTNLNRALKNIKLEIMVDFI